MKKNIRQMKPEDLPKGVVANLGEDYRGLCYIFDHIEHGCLGKLVMISIEEKKQKLVYDFFEGNELRGSSNYIKRMEIFREVVQIVSQAFDVNFHSLNQHN